MKDKNIKKQHSAQALSTDDLENVAGGGVRLTASQQFWLLKNHYNVTHSNPGCFEPNGIYEYDVSRDGKKIDNIFIRALLRRHNIR